MSPIPACRSVAVLDLIAPPTSPAVMSAETWDVRSCALLVRAKPGVGREDEGAKSL
jgi:hypothetical protein